MTINFVCYDYETTVQRENGEIDGSPYHPDNKLVCVAWVECINGVIQEPQSLVFHHAEKPIPDSPRAFRKVLRKHKIGVAHNHKFDAGWSQAMGWELPALHCTMIREFMFAAGRSWTLNLKDVADRYGVSAKKSDLVEEMFKSGTGYDQMPLDTVLEYALGDVVSCAEVYLEQEKLLETEQWASMRPTLDLMYEMTEFLLEIEENGLKIDMDVVAEVREEYEQEINELERWFDEALFDVMGAMPRNLKSGIDLTAIIYGYEVLDKAGHKEIFNIGTDARGKPLFPPRMTKSGFKKAIKMTCAPVYQTDVSHCFTCDGEGITERFTKAGKLRKNPVKCKECTDGVIYTKTTKRAGLRLEPESAADASVHGFKTDKHTIKRLIEQAREKNNDFAVLFLEKLVRLSSIKTYLQSFVHGFERYTRADGLLHTSFNQCIAATGRLSSTRPNLQNIPKHTGFPLRRSIISRFNNKLAEIDFAGLEFKVAGQVTGCSNVFRDIENGVDIHKQTASIIYQISPDEVTKQQRSSIKVHSFGPLFGSKGGGFADHIKAYYDRFFDLYPGVREYHKQCFDAVLKQGYIVIPGGKRYAWDNAQRSANGELGAYSTTIKNYPVQGTAALLLLLSCVRALRFFRQHRLRSCLVLTVHDSLVIDLYPGEEEIAIKLVCEAMEESPKEFSERFDYDWTMPITVEAEIGPNWFEMSDLSPS